MKRTPLEQAIARVSDRRRKHDLAQKERGFVRVTVTVPTSCAEEIKDLAEQLRAREERRLIMGTARA